MNLVRSEMADESIRGARVLPVPPPVYYGAAFAAGVLLDSSGGRPLAIGGRPPTVVMGLVLLAVGAALALGAVAAVRRHHTTIVPHRPVAALLTTGAYQISRNPMYTGLAIAYAGVVLIIGTWWPLLTLPLALLAVRVLVIGPEEQYLTAAFGQTYHDYRARTRRWI